MSLAPAFTRAFNPGAPLLVGYFENDRLVGAVRGLPAASRVLEAERNRHPERGSSTSNV